MIESGIMIKIRYSENNLAERKYVIDTLFKEFLGLDYTSSFYPTPKNCYEIELPNGNIISIKDAFFNLHPNDLEYLNLSNIPISIKYAYHDILPEKNIPIIYGDSNIEIHENKIYCDIDIFSGSFFMLSRWEEYVIADRDKFNRFPATASLAYKFNFHDRPIVNEYTELLKKFINHLDPDLKFKQFNYSQHISCDVDRFNESFYRKTVKLWDYLKNFKRNNVSKNITNNPYTKSYINSNLADYYYNGLYYIMEINEKYNNSVSFNIIPLRTDFIADRRFNYNHKLIHNILKEFVTRGHSVGFHPGFNTYNNEKLFGLSANRYHHILDSINYSSDYLGGRQHYLRWKFPETPLLWEKYSFSYDSTLSYADISGFRCGVCYPFDLFDCLGRRMLSLKEVPLIVMEASVFYYEGLGFSDEAYNRICFFKDICRKYNGTFSLLWHNTVLNSFKQLELYEQVISY